MHGQQEHNQNLVIEPDSVMMEDGTFQAFVKPKQVTIFMMMLTGTTNKMVRLSPCFSTVAVEFF